MAISPPLNRVEVEQTIAEQITYYHYIFIGLGILVVICAGCIWLGLYYRNKRLSSNKGLKYVIIGIALFIYLSYAIPIRIYFYLQLVNNPAVFVVSDTLNNTP